MANVYGKGNKGKATKLHSLIVRSLGYCQSCGEPDYAKLQCAHIVSRTYSTTRTDEKNAFCLCATCHRRFTDWPLEFSRFVIDKIGSEEYDRLKWKAESGIRVKFDWDEELGRLKNLHKDIFLTSATNLLLGDSHH